jgi:hypothetical protein
MTETNDVSTPEFETLVGLLDDEYARDILCSTSQEPMNVPELSEQSDASEATLYRRVEQLLEADLLAEQTRVRSDGHHDTVYAATLDGVQIRLVDGEFEFDLTRAEDATDRLQRLWSEF